MLIEISKYILLPSNIITLLMLLTVVFWALRSVKAFRITALLTIFIYFILGCGPVSQLLLSNLEYQYLPYTEHPDDEIANTIIILTGDAEIKPLTPSSSYMNKSSAFRVMEARRIYNLNKERSIIISGLNNVPQIMKQALVTMDVPDNQISLDSQSANTYESASNLSTKLGKQKFILVTSAGHMPRAIAVFKSQGLNPVAAPTEYMSRKNIFAAQYLPAFRHLIYVDIATHEYLATIWYKLSGKISQPE